MPYSGTQRDKIEHAELARGYVDNYLLHHLVLVAELYEHVATHGLWPVQHHHHTAVRLLAIVIHTRCVQLGSRVTLQLVNVEKWTYM